MAALHLSVSVNADGDASRPPMAGSVMTTYSDQNCQNKNGGPNGLGQTCQHWGGSGGSFMLNDVLSGDGCNNLSVHWHIDANCAGSAGVIYRNVKAFQCYGGLLPQAGWVQLVCNNPNF